MENNTSLTFTGRLRSIKCALAGVRLMIASQQNAWIHAAATLAVVAVGFFFGLTNAEWCWIVLAVVSVWTAEALNTAFEYLTDVASPQFHPLAGKAKDVAAGAVLITAIGSVIIGVLVLGPHAMTLVNTWRWVRGRRRSRSRELAGNEGDLLSVWRKARNKNFLMLPSFAKAEPFAFRAKPNRIARG